MPLPVILAVDGHEQSLSDIERELDDRYSRSYRVVTVTTADDATVALEGFAEAGEDSTLTSTMNAKGQVLEIRVFRSHPQLAKVEATWISPQQEFLELFLRDGNKREVETDKLQNLKTATAAELLQLAGIGTARPAAPDKSKPGAKQPR